MLGGQLDEYGEPFSVLDLVKARLPRDIIDGHKVPNIVNRHDPVPRSIEHHVARGHHAIEGWRHLGRVNVQSS